MDSSASDLRARVVPRGPGRAALGRRPLHRRRGAALALGLSLLAHGVALPVWLVSVTAIEPPAARARQGGGQVLTVRLPMFEDDECLELPRLARATESWQPPVAPAEPRPTLLDTEPVPTWAVAVSDRAPDPSAAVWQVRATRRPATDELSPNGMVPSNAAAAPPALRAGQPSASAPSLAPTPSPTSAAGPAETGVPTPSPPPTPTDEPAPADPGPADGAATADARPAPDNPAPRYPGLARRKGWEGEVRLAVAVDAEGQPVEVTIDQSSGRRVLDEAAAAAVFRWRFLPATRDGEAVSGHASVLVAFVIED